MVNPPAASRICRYLYQLRISPPGSNHATRARNCTYRCTGDDEKVIHGVMHKPSKA